jgi:predicted HTH transcriptional regulator
LPDTPRLSWSEADLDKLIGQPESIRREFKSGRMFDESENRWVAKISAEVSALANTEGGELFLGIDEDKKSKPRVAISIDGASIGLAPERLQQLIEGNVSPYLPGIRVPRVLLSKNPNKVAFVVQIPQGNTALSLECKPEASFADGDYSVRWKVFLDNSPPSSGEIDLGNLIESIRRQKAADR